MGRILLSRHWLWLDAVRLLILRRILLSRHWLRLGAVRLLVLRGILLSRHWLWLGAIRLLILWRILLAGHWMRLRAVGRLRRGRVLLLRRRVLRRSGVLLLGRHRRWSGPPAARALLVLRIGRGLVFASGRRRIRRFGGPGRSSVQFPLDLGCWHYMV